MTEQIERAKIIARAAHDSIEHKRKYSGEPYWTHTERVAGLVKNLGLNEDSIIAALFHDVLEDVAIDTRGREYDLAFIFDNFGPVVANIVLELTDRFTKEAFPSMNREQRKKNEAVRLSMISRRAKIIKLCDLVDNTADIVLNAPGFAVKYLKEKKYILELFLASDPTLVEEEIYKKAISQIS